MQTTQDIYRKVTRVVAESLCVDEGEVHPTSRLQEDL